MGDPGCLEGLREDMWHEERGAPIYLCMAAAFRNGWPAA